MGIFNFIKKKRLDSELEVARLERKNLLSIKKRLNYTVRTLNDIGFTLKKIIDHEGSIMSQQTDLKREIEEWKILKKLINECFDPV